jgi:carbonic anhydrase
MNTFEYQNEVYYYTITDIGELLVLNNAGNDVNDHNLIELIQQHVESQGYEECE